MMNVNSRKGHFSRDSLRGSRTATTVLLRMAQDDARASRIRELKDLHPEVTFRQIADYVGVSERSANEWAAKGTISYENSKTLTRFFQERGHPDLDELYVWRGPAGDAPDLIGALTDPKASVAGQLSELREQVQRNSARIAKIEALLDGIAASLPAPKGRAAVSVKDMVEELWGELADKPAPANT